MAEKQKNNRNARWEADIELVFREMVRIHKGLPQIGLPPPPVPPTQVSGSLPHPNGGWVICGVEADLKIWGIVEEHLSKMENGSQIETSSVAVAFRKEIGDLFFRQRPPFSGVQLDQAIARAVKVAKKELKTITHWIPCHLVANNEPASITIGPVTFQRTPHFMQSLQPGFERYIKEFCSDQVSANQGGAEVDAARRYYEQFDWVAEVTISDFAPRLSAERARLCVQAALDVFRLFLGRLHGRLIEAEGPGIRAIEGARIIRMANGKLDVSQSRSLATVRLEDRGWSQFVTVLASSNFVGSVLRTLTSANVPPPLCQRLLDALNWFGQAVAETSPGAAITKLVSAIERITQGRKKDEDGSVTKQFCDRAAALCVDPENPDFYNWRTKLNDLYGLRSNITHGSTSPLDPHVRAEVQQAEKLTQRIIVQAIGFFEQLGAHRMEWNPKRLDEEMDRFVQRIQRTIPPMPSSTTPETGSKDL